MSWWARYIVYFSFIITLIMASVTAFVMLHFNYYLPDLKKLESYQPELSTYIYAKDGTVIGQKSKQNRIYIPYENIPPLLVQAFISAEDRDFFHHSGLDYKGILRALIHNVSSDERMQGASTITQQLARNLFLSNEKSLLRKLKEALLSFRIEKHLNKEKIMELYLNEIYLGANAYGIASAAKRYFNKSYTALTLEEIGILAAMPKAPSAYNPFVNPERAVIRRDWILQAMADQGYVSQKSAMSAINTPLTLTQTDQSHYDTAKYFTAEIDKFLDSNFKNNDIATNGLTIFTTLDPELQQLAQTSLQDGLIAYSKRHGYHGKINSIPITQQWDIDLQKLALPNGISPLLPAIILDIDDTHREIIVGTSDKKIHPIRFKDSAWIWKNHPLAAERSLNIHDFLSMGDVVLIDLSHKNAQLSQLPHIEGAIVVLDPHTGDILAMQGGFSHERSQFNRAVQAQRQPGSAIKPFVYLTGLERDYPPTYLIDDEPIDYSTLNEQDRNWQNTLFPTKKSWSPKNSSGYFYGSTTLRQALERSFNVATVRFALQVGIPHFEALLKRFNLIDSNISIPLSATLGSQETTLLNLTLAYGMIANGGYEITPHYIDYIQNFTGITLYQKSLTCNPCHDKRNDPSLLLQEKLSPPTITDPRSAYQLTSLLEGVIRHGTGRRANHLPFAVAGKTGTTNDSKDAWFIGYTDKLVVGVYTGFDTPESLGKNEQGASVALPIFIHFMEKAAKKYPPQNFPVPSGIEFIPIDHKTGLLPSSKTQANSILIETFKAGQSPQSKRKQHRRSSATSHKKSPPKNIDPPTSSPAARGTGGIY